jgi:outer membrane protein OmpA-like peptidoglycan-associated protein
VYRQQRCGQVERYLETEAELEIERALNSVSEALGEGPSGQPQIFPPQFIFGPKTGLVVLRRFRLNSAQLTPEHQRMIDGISRNVVSRFRTTTQVNLIRVIGHADRSGNQDFNLNLGHRRGRSVRVRLHTLIELASARIPDFEIPVFEECSAGAARPDASPNAADQRRVEVLLLPVVP